MEDFKGHFKGKMFHASMDVYSQITSVLVSYCGSRLVS